MQNNLVAEREKKQGGMEALRVERERIDHKFREAFSKCDLPVSASMSAFEPLVRAALSELEEYDAALWGSLGLEPEGEYDGDEE